MKKILSFLVLLAGVTMFTSCSDDDATYTSVTPLGITSNDVCFEAEGGTGSITVEATGTVTAETTSKWIDISVNGNIVTVIAQGNPSIEGRSARIVLTANGATTNVIAIQKGVVYQLEGGVSNFTIGSAASSMTLGVTSLASVSVKSLSDWISATYKEEDSQIVLDFEANTALENRVGYVVVETGSLKDTLTITQKSSYEIIGGTSYAVGSSATTLKIGVVSSFPVTVKSLDRWMIASYSSANSEITVNITANTSSQERVGHVAIEAGSIKDTLTITQSGR